MTRTGPGGRDRRDVAGTAVALGIVVFGLVGFAVYYLTTVRGGPVPWASLGTEDAHALAFVDGDPDRVLFGHHSGVLASTDGGRSWTATAAPLDAMSVAPAADEALVIAGHEVFAASQDGGRSWQPVPAQLPTLDIHGLARDPVDPDRMWAYLATGGLWSTTDGGREWQQVTEQNVLLPVAFAGSGGTQLLGVTDRGVVRSRDAGRTWERVGDPELYPIASLAAATDGSVLVAGGPGGLARSDDGGQTWQQLPWDGQVLAVAVAEGGTTVAAVTVGSRFYRSDDGGRSWPGPAG